METITLPAGLPESIEATIELLREGEIVAFPTDTVYGLGSNAFYSPGIIKLFEAKGRDANKAIAVLVGTADQMDLLTHALNENAKKLIAAFWPGALTIVVPKREDIPELLSAGSSVGIRMPNHPVTLELLNKFGPLATTSANLSGGFAPQKAKDVHAQLNKRIPLILDGGTCPGGTPSTVVDCTTNDVTILRLGALSEAQIRKVLE